MLIILYLARITHRERRKGNAFFDNPQKKSVLRRFFYVFYDVLQREHLGFPRQ